MVAAPADTICSAAGCGASGHSGPRMLDRFVLVSPWAEPWRSGPCRGAGQHAPCPRPALALEVSSNSEMVSTSLTWFCTFLRAREDPRVPMRADPGPVGGRWMDALSFGPKEAAKSSIPCMVLGWNAVGGSCAWSSPTVVARSGNCPSRCLGA